MTETQTLSPVVSSYPVASALCIASFCLGNMDDALSCLLRYGFPVNDADQKEASDLADNLYIAEPSYIATCYPDFPEMMKEIIESPDNQYAEFFAEIGEQKQINHLPVVLADHLLNKLRLEKNWRDADGVARHLEETEGIYLSKTRQEFHDYSRRLGMEGRFRTCGRFLYPELTYLLFVHDLNQKEVSVDPSVIERKKMDFEKRNPDFLRQKNSTGKQVRQIFAERYPDLPRMKEKDVVFCAQLADVDFRHGADNVLYYHYIAVDKIIGLFHAQQVQKQQRLNFRELYAFSKIFIRQYGEDAVKAFEEQWANRC